MRQSFSSHAFAFVRKRNSRTHADSSLESHATINPDRRNVLAELAAGAAFGLPSTGHAQPDQPITRRIPSSNEVIPAVGLDTWITFNVGNDPVARDACVR